MVNSSKSAGVNLDADASRQADKENGGHKWSATKLDLGLQNTNKLAEEAVIVV